MTIDQSATVAHSLTVFVNGKQHVLSDGHVDPRTTLIAFLRDHELTGTKLGCGEGGCGACTVMISRYNKHTQSVEHFSANACLTPLCALDGCAVTTVEGIGGMRQGLHPVQRRIAEMHGSQCGFCTPGIVMAIYTQLRRKPDSTPHEIEESLDGNLCRCTGYRPILDAARSLSSNKGCAMGDKCCGGVCGNNNTDTVTATTSASVSSCGSSSCCTQSDNKGEESSGCCAAKSVSVSSTEKVMSRSLSLAEELAERHFTEPIFPPSLLRYEHRDVVLSDTEGRTHWFQPLSLSRLVSLKREYPNARLVVGNTEVGIEVKFKGCEYPHLINPSLVPELQELRFVEAEESESERESGVIVGGAVTINRLRDFLGDLVKKLKANPLTQHRASVFLAIQQMFTWFASNHVRNVACVAGNIVNASPISDLNPMLLAARATLTLVSHEGERVVPLSSFFLGYRKVDLKADEIVKHVFIPSTREGEILLPFKQARRREDDISIVTAGYRFLLQREEAADVDNQGEEEREPVYVIRDCSFALGGMAPITISAPKTRDALLDQRWSYDTLQRALDVMRAELTLPENVPGGQSEFRTALCLSFLMKAFLAISHEHLRIPFNNTQREISGARNFVVEDKSMSRGEQLYVERALGEGLVHARPSPLAPDNSTASSVIKKGENKKDSLLSRLQVVGKPVMHKSAESQACGEAQYAWDTAVHTKALHAALVTSTRAHAILRSIDASAAESMPGFVAFFDHKDIPGHNAIGAVVQDEELIVSREVKYFGALLGVVVAETHEQALAAARAVRVEYEDEKEIAPVNNNNNNNNVNKAIISIEDAIEAQSFFDIHHEIHSGDVAAARAHSDFVVQGTMRIGGQEHFYLETQCAVATPLDNGFVEVLSSTQNVNETQKMCAEVCALPFSKVHVHCKRLGGGFGGKESRSIPIACVATLCALKLQHAVSLNIERDLDMSISGQRHPFIIHYRAGCDRDGELTFLDSDLFSNAGFSLDLSSSIMDRALFSSDNMYRWKNVRVFGNLCRTNLPTNTAYRGFGTPQGLLGCEIALEHLSAVSGIPSKVLREKNMYREGDRTHFNQRLEDLFVPQMWRDLQELAQYEERERLVEEFNRDNRWRKRGIAILPVKFGINFGPKFLNQAGALVHVHTDGSVLVAHGGTEMGQGLFTKMIQVAAQAFDIPDSLVFTSQTSTDTVANASATAASLSTDLYGMAVLDACEQIVERLRPVRARLPPDADWTTVVNAAYFDRVNLSAQGFYVIDGKRCGFDWDNPDQTQRGCPFNYFTQGVACSEVEIDCLTGDHKVLRSDVLMDVGKSINPALDIGQIEGAFVQGQGWCTTEELVWGDKDHRWVREGQLFTRGPGTYKIPAAGDIPQDFRVHLADTHNKFAVHSSKAVGEPPFVLGSTVFFAIKNAIDAARKENGIDGYYQLDCPATSERIRMACGDDISKMCVADRHDPVDFHPKGSW